MATIASPPLAVPPARRVPLSAKLFYGAGAIAYGIKDNGFSVFLLIFYNQVIGLAAGAVGFAIMIALVLDAFIDPAIGSLSDRTHSRWGRRHPWLYGSALPIAISWVMLWSPPAMSHQALLGYLVLTAILARAAIATNEVPSLALAPEMTSDYHERTAVLAWRYLFGWAGGLAMLTAAYGIFLAPPLGAPTGPLAPQGYRLYGQVGALLMALSVLISALGLHRRYARPPARRLGREGFGQTLRGIRQALSNRPFQMLMLAGTFAYLNQGVGFAISNYNLAYVWRFGPQDFFIYALVLLGSVTAAAFVVLPIVRPMSKGKAAALLAGLASLLHLSPYALRLLGRFPLPGETALLPTLLTFVGLGTACSISVFILSGSMMADVVEASEERTGRREEGLFYSGSLFMQKCTSGLGIFVTGLILSAAQFPAAVRPAEVAPAVIDHMILLYVGTSLLITIGAISFYLRFPFGRAEHDARIARLAAGAPLPPPA